MFRFDSTPYTHMWGTRATAALQRGCRVLALEFPDRAYILRSVREWDIGVRPTVWTSRNTIPTPEEWKQAFAHIAHPDCLAIVIVPTGMLDIVRRQVEPILSASDRSHTSWLRQTDLFLSPADVQWYLDQATSTRSVHEVINQVGLWPQLIPIETGTDSAHGSTLDAIRLILTQAELSHEHRSFLRRCGAAERLTPQALRTTWPAPNRFALLHWAQETGWIAPGVDPSTLGTIPVQWRAVLREDLMQHAPAEGHTLLCSLVRCSREDGSTASVLLHQARQTGDPVCLSNIVEQHAIELLATDTALTIHTLEGLPNAVYEQNSTLRTVRSVTGTLLSIDGVGEERTLAHTASLSPLESTFRAMLTARVQGRIPDAVQAASGCRAVLESPSPTDAPAVHQFSDFFWLQLGITLLRNMDLTQAHEDFEHTVQARGRDPGFLQRDALGKLALLHAFDGNIPAARRKLREAAKYPLPGPRFRERVHAAEQLATALILAEGTDQNALDDVWRSAALRPASERDELWGFRIFTLQRVAAALGLDTVALHTIPKMAIQSNSACHDPQSALVGVAQAQALLSVGALAKARRVIAHLTNESLDQSVVFVSARLALLSGHAAEARRTANQLTKCANGTQRIAVEGQFLSAAATWRMGHRQEAIQLVQAAQRTADALGISSTARSIPQAIAGELFSAAGLRDTYSRTLCTTVPPQAPQLTAATLDVLDALATTDCTAEIAQQLHRSENTVKTHLRRLYATLNVHSRDEALRAAERLGILR